MVLLPALMNSRNDDSTCKVIGRHLMSETIKDKPNRFRNRYHLRVHDQCW